MVFRSNNRYDSEHSSRLLRVLGKKLLFVIIITITAIVFGVWFFFMNEKSNTIESRHNFVQPNCYIINAKQICPTVNG